MADLKLALIISAVFRGGQAFGKAGGGLAGLKKAISAVAIEIAALAALATFDFLKKSLAVFQQFSDEMQAVQAASGATGAEFDKLQDLAKELGATMGGFTAAEAAKGMRFLAFAGFDTNEILAATPQVLKLAQLGMLDLGVAAQISSSILRGFGFEVDQMGRVVDVLAATFTSSNQDLTQLGASFKFVGPVASGLGIQFEEVAATLAVLADSGIRGAMAGTTIRGMLLRLAAPTGKAKRILDELNISLFELNPAGKATETALQGIAQELGILEDEITTGELAIKRQSLALTEFGFGLRDAEMLLDDLESELDETESELGNLENSLKDAEVNLRNTERAFKDQEKAVQDAQGEYSRASSELDRLSREFEKATSASEQLSGQLDDASLQVSRNQLEISKIRQEAAKESRQLTEDEEADIQTLQTANDDLRISMQELRIEQTELRKEAETKEFEDLQQALTDASGVVDDMSVSLEEAQTDLQKTESALADQQTIVDGAKLSYEQQIVAVEAASSAYAAQQTTVERLTVTQEENKNSIDLMKFSLDQAKLSQEELEVESEKLEDVFQSQKGALKGIAEIIDEFSKGLEGLSLAEETVAVKAIFGQQGMAGFKILLASSGDEAALAGDKIRDLTTKLEESAGAADEAFGIMEEGAGVQMKILQSAVEALMLQFGELIAPLISEFIPILQEDIGPLIENVVIPAFAGLMKAVIFLLDIFTDFFDFLGEHEETVEALGFGVKVVAFILLGIFAEALLGVLGVIAAVILLTEALGFIFGILAQLIVGSIFLIWDTTLKPFFEWFDKTFGPAITAVADLWMDGWNVMKNVVKTVMDKIMPFLEPIMTFFDWLDDMLNSMFLGSTWPDAWDAALGAVDSILGPLEGAFDTITGLFDGLMDSIGGLMDSVGDIAGGFTSMAGSALSTISDFASGVGDKLKGLASSAISWGADLAKNFSSGVKSAGGTLKKAGGKLLDTGKALFSFDERSNDEMAMGWGEDMIKFFTQGMTAALPSMETAISEAFTGVGGSLTQEFQGPLTTGASAGGQTIVQSQDDITVILEVERLDAEFDIEAAAEEIADMIHKKKKRGFGPGFGAGAGA